MTYDKVKIIFEKDGEELVRGEVLARENSELTAEYLLQNFWTMHKATQETEHVCRFIECDEWSKTCVCGKTES